MSRDPRTDPRPGDCVRIAGRRSYVQSVSATALRAAAEGDAAAAETRFACVIYGPRRDMKWGGRANGHLCTLADWRRLTLGADVVETASIPEKL